MIHTTPDRVPTVIDSGNKTYKPEMEEAIKRQHFVIKTSFPGVSMGELYKRAEEKDTKRLYAEVERDFNNWDSNEEL